MSDPFKVDGPTIISTSGGRTSGYMLWRVLQANGGILPKDCHAVFCNTGLEHPNTLTFVHQIEERWCPVTWLEYRRVDGEPATFAVVDYCHASRNGEPFSQMNHSKKLLPNPVMRTCTAELKIRTSNRWAKALNMSEWTRFVGLRADEPRRVNRLKGDISAEMVKCPLSDAGVNREEVMAFWGRQDFDLYLPDDRYGNCVGCFLKGRYKIAAIARDTPEYLNWWAEEEEKFTKYGNTTGAYFRIDRPSYRQILTQVSVQGRLLGDIGLDDETIPCMCSD